MFEEDEDIVELDEEAVTCESVYKRGYNKLFNGISAVIEHTHTHKQTIAALKHLQILAEEHYLEHGED